MNRNSSSNTPVRFRPASLVDFKNYAKNLAWMIDGKTQATQELLARIYGYSGLHELQIHLAETADEPVSEENYHPYIDELELADRALRMLAEHLGHSDLGKLSARQWSVREIGLFSRPTIHYRSFRKVKFMYETLDGTASVQGSLSVANYATVDYRPDDDEAFLAFTRMGRSVFDAICRLKDDIEKKSQEIKKTRIEALGRICREHPNNPWAHAMIVEAFRKFEDPYDSVHIRGILKGPDVDFDPGASAIRAIALFEELYGGLGDKAPIHATSVFSYEYGGDCYYWPVSLARGVVKLLEDKDYSGAWHWMKKYHAVLQSPFPQLRTATSMLMLANEDERLWDRYTRNREEYDDLDDDDYGFGDFDEVILDDTEYLCLASWCAADNDIERAADLYARAIATNIVCLYPFNPATKVEVMEKDPSDRWYEYGFDHNAFRAIVAPFWEKYPDALERMKSMTNERVVEAALEWTRGEKGREELDERVRAVESDQVPYEKLRQEIRQGMQDRLGE